MITFWFTQTINNIFVWVAQQKGDSSRSSRTCCWIERDSSQSFSPCLPQSWARCQLSLNGRVNYARATEHFQTNWKNLILACLSENPLPSVTYASIQLYVDLRSLKNCLKRSYRNLLKMNFTMVLCQTTNYQKTMIQTAQKIVSDVVRLMRNQNCRPIFNLQHKILVGSIQISSPGLSSSVCWLTRSSQPYNGIHVSYGPL